MTATSPGASALVVDAGSPWGRSALAAVRALHSAGLRAVVGRPAGQPSLASSSRSCSGTVALPDVNDPGFRCAVAEEVTRASHVVALAASDAALVALDAPGCRLTDKSVVSARAADAGIPVLAEVVVSQGNDLDEALGGLTWPVIAKPLVRRAGDPPAREVGCYEDVVGLLTGRPLLLQPRDDGELTAVSGVMYDGELRAAVAQRSLRLWPRRAGTTTWGVTVQPDPCRLTALSAVLHDHQGVFQAQFVGPYLVDVNPRVYGSLPLALAAGANLPAIYCALLQGRHVPWTEGRAGVTYRWVEGDVRHVLAAARDGQLSWPAALSALRPRRRTTHSVVAWSDPRPALLRARFVVKELLPW
jgi:hypothetical protein